MSSLTVEGFHNDTLKNREKSNSSYLIKTSCEDVTIRTQQRYSDDNQKKKLASVFDCKLLNTYLKWISHLKFAQNKEQFDMNCIIFLKIKMRDFYTKKPKNSNFEWIIFQR